MTHCVMTKSRKRQDGADAGPESPDTSQESTPVGTTGRDGSDAGSYTDRVAMRAYELYLARGGSDGGDFDDWLRAERELSGRREGEEDGRE
jgi:hypothetical protein